MKQNNCVAVVLAGGKSERMGQPKGLLNFNGKPWLLEQLSRLKSAGITQIFIGLGFESALYFKEIPFLKEAQNHSVNWEDLYITVVINPSPERGSFSTLKGILKILETRSHVLIVPIDVPILNTKSLKAFINKDEDIIKPQFQGKNGHPILLKDKVVTYLLSLPETARLDDFIKLNPQFSLNLWQCTDEQVLLNINTPKVWEDYQATFQKIT